MSEDLQFKENEQDVKDLSGSILDNIQAAVVIHDAGTNIIASNSKARELLGLTKDQMFGKNAIDSGWFFVTSDNKRLSFDQYPVNQVLKTGRVLENLTLGIYRPATADTLWVLIYAKPVFNEKGNIKQVFVTFMDITGLHNLKKKQQFQTDLAIGLSKKTGLTETLEEILSTIFQLDEFNAGAIYLVNERTGGLAIKASLGLSQMFLKKVKHYDSDDIRTQMVMKGDPIYLQASEVPSHIKKDLETDGIISLAAFPIEFGENIIGSINLASHSHDIITDNTREILESISKIEVGTAIFRIIAKEALKESETKFKGLVEVSSDWIWEVDDNGVYVYASPQVETLLGYKPEKIIGLTPFDFMPPEEAGRIQKTFKNIVKNANPMVALENVCRHKDGRFIVLETSGVPIFDAAGKVKGYRGIDRDITNRKRTEEKIKDLNKSLEKKVKDRTNQLKQLNEHLAQSEDQMRKEIASELHDSVVQNLALSIFELKNIQDSGPPVNFKNIIKTKEHLEQSIREIRSLIYQLSPPILDDFEIDIALGALIEGYNDKHQTNIKYINNTNTSFVTSLPVKSVLYRSVNELIINIIKHSGSKNAEIELSDDENNLILKIKDHGVGFDIDKLKAKDFSGFGIKSISERINSLEGKIKLLPKIGKGMKILISLSKTACWKR